MFSVDRIERSGLLCPVSFELMPEQVLIVSGVSGSGKSLLLRALADMDAHQGTVYLHGKSQQVFDPEQWRQQVMWFAAETAWWYEEVSAHFETGEAQEKWLTESLSKLLLPRTILNKKVQALSSGEKQRLALLRGLQKHPKVLLLDETTANLDLASTEALEKFIEIYLQQMQACAVWVSHDLAQRERLSLRERGVKQLALTPVNSERL